MEFSTEDLRTWVARQTRVIPIPTPSNCLSSNERRHATHLSQRSAAINQCEKALQINPPYGDDPLPTRASALSLARAGARIRRIPFLLPHLRRRERALARVGSGSSPYGGLIWRAFSHWLMAADRWDK